MSRKQSNTVEYFPHLDLKIQRDKFDTYWSEGTRKLTRPKSAFRNWCERAEKYRLEDTSKGNGHKQEVIKSESIDSQLEKRGIKID